MDNEKLIAIVLTFIGAYFLNPIISGFFKFLTGLFKKKEEYITEADLLEFENKCDCKYASRDSMQNFENRMSKELSEIKGKLSDVIAQVNTICVDIGQMAESIRWIKEMFNNLPKRKDD